MAKDKRYPGMRSPAGGKLGVKRGHRNVSPASLANLRPFKDKKEALELRKDPEKYMEQLDKSKRERSDKEVYEPKWSPYAVKAMFSDALMQFLLMEPANVQKCERFGTVMEEVSHNLVQAARAGDLKVIEFITARTAGLPVAHQDAPPMGNQLLVVLNAPERGEIRIQQEGS